MSDKVFGGGGWYFFEYVNVILSLDFCGKNTDIKSYLIAFSEFFSR